MGNNYNNLNYLMWLQQQAQQNAQGNNQTKEKFRGWAKNRFQNSAILNNGAENSGVIAHGMQNVAPEIFSTGTAAAGETAGALGGGAAGAMGGAGGAAGMLGPIGAIIGIKIKNNEKAGKLAKAAAEGQLSQTNQMSEQMSNNLMQQGQDKMQSAKSFTPQFAGLNNPQNQSINSNAYNNYMQEAGLGGVNQKELELEYANDLENAKAEGYNDYDPNAKTYYDYAVDNTTAPITGGINSNNFANNRENRGLMSKFASGLSDFMKGYQENRNSGFNPDNLTANQFVTKSEIQNPLLTAYQDTLRNQGIDENIINAVAQGKNNGNKDIDNWIKANPEALTPITEYTYANKGKMARLGEAAGTISRMAQNPVFQGLVSGVVSTALTGSPFYGVNAGYMAANRRQMSDIYKDVMKKYGVDISPNTFGNIDSKAMDAIMTPKYKQDVNDRLIEKMKNDDAYRQAALNQKLNEFSYKQLIDDKKLKISEKELAEKIRHDRAKEAKWAKDNDNKQDNAEEFNSNLARYITYINNPNIDEATKAKARRGMIENYGKDFLDVEKKLTGDDLQDPFGSLY